MYWHFAIFVPFNLIIESSVEVDAHNLQFGFNFTAWGKNLYYSHLKEKTPPRVSSAGSNLMFLA